METNTPTPLKGQTAIVTGASRGFGLGIARQLAKQGANVWLTGRCEKDLQNAASELGGQFVVADVTVPEDWDRLMETIQKESSSIDILVNNAGGGIHIAPIDEQSDAQIIQSISLNLTSVMLGCRRVVPLMKQQRSGIIFNISSGCATHAWPGWGPYSAAKSGLVQFGRCLHTELREYDVRVTSLIPYWGATNFVAAADIQGHPATNDATIRDKCIQSDEIGELVAQLCTMPAHLVVPQITLQPLVQEIIPM